jgi:hypothetical protein
MLQHARLAASARRAVASALVAPACAAIRRGRGCRPATTAAAASGADQGVINKQVIATTMSDGLYSYLLAHTREPPALRALRDETASQHGAHMQVGGGGGV